MHMQSMAEEAASYLLLHSDYQVQIILRAAREEAMTVRSRYEALRKKHWAPPAILAIYGQDRVDPEDAIPGLTGLGYTTYANMKEKWDTARYRRVFVTLFGVNDAEADKMAEKIETHDSEPLKDKLRRVAEKLLDTVLWRLYDVHTVAPDPDIAYEWMQLGKQMMELGKRAGYASVPFDNISQMVKVQSQTGEIRDYGDVMLEGDVVVVDKDRLAGHLEAFTNFLKKEPLPPGEMGGLFSSITKTLGKVGSAVGKTLGSVANPLVSAVVQPIAAVVKPAAAAVSAVAPLAKTALELSPMGLMTKVAGGVVQPLMGKTSVVAPATQEDLRRDFAAQTNAQDQVEMAQALNYVKTQMADLTNQLLDQAEKTQRVASAIGIDGEPLSWQ